MFGFDGEYRRRPLQSLGGASQTSDRETVIKKAQQERQKRNEQRRQNNGAIVLQSYTRSFIHRQRRKRLEREAYDDFVRQRRDSGTASSGGVAEDAHLAFLLQRILFFYDSKQSKDAERLIEMCQQVLRNPARLMHNSVREFIWLHRLKKLLDLCIVQLSVPQAAQAIPLRILETFTAPASVERYVGAEVAPLLVQTYLNRIFAYLIERQYFARLRRLLEQRCPPLDGETLHPPNPMAEALFQLIVRPLGLAQRRTEATAATANHICLAFSQHILALPFSDPVRYFVLPCLAEHEEFPFDYVLRLLQQQTRLERSAERMQVGGGTNAAPTFTPASTTLDNSVPAAAVVTQQGQPRQQTVSHAKIFNGFLLNSLLILDRKQLGTVHSKSLWGDYIKIIADVSPKILQLPKSALKMTSAHFQLQMQRADADESSEEEEEDDDNNDEDTDSGDVKDDDNNGMPMDVDAMDVDGHIRMRARNQKRRTSASNDALEVAVGGSALLPLSGAERQALLECIALLNEPARVKVIVDYAEEHLEDTVMLYALCEVCHNLMVYNKLAIFEYKLLNTLAFMPEFIRAVWFALAAQSSRLGFSAPLVLISKGVVPKQDGVERTIPLLATFCMLFGGLLPTLHDAEFCEDELLLKTAVSNMSTSASTFLYTAKAPATAPSAITAAAAAAAATTTLEGAQHIRFMPFSIAEIVQMSKTLRDISMGLVELAFPDTRSNLNEHYRFVLGRSDTDDKKMRQQKQIWSNLLKVVVFVLNQIHTRDLRLGFCPDAHWTVTRLDLPLDRPTDLPLTRGSRTRGIRPFQPIRDFTREDFENGPPMSTKQIRSITILREIPFVVSFSKRVGILQGLVAADKMRVQGNFQAFLQGPSITLTVRRSHLYEDAYDRLRPENEPDLRLKFRIQFVSTLGLEEAGIDGGGVFREFLSELIKTAFDPNRGFFMVTTDNKLYPNPTVADLVPDFEKHYYFIGRILGKAIYENLLVELPLAEFFLTKLAGKYADVDIHQLASLDPELYKNLLYLKDYEGDVSALNLDFTVASSSLGHTQVVELKPNGQSIPVTASNRIEYLQLMADYKLNVQIRQHCVAFRKGLSNVLPVEWLYMFSNKELQILISGAEIPIDLEDLKRYCKYGGEYSPEHPSIVAFWSALEGFDDLQRRQLLKFVTSCSRPPLLGFKDLDPPFFIQNAGDMERLPTASTCTNLLKLPPFRSVEKMREKLLYAIQSGVGFELS